MIDLRDQKAAAELEKRIREEIAERQVKNRELQNEIRSFEQILLKARWQKELVKRIDVTRRNSVGRAHYSRVQYWMPWRRLDEHEVLDPYTKMPVLIVGTLREGTIRTTLHRVKNRGLIVSAGNGKW
ncbi:hypothetical protein JQ581_00605 [Bradyrhizobium liaoningense]|uniref:hypothetical protein n=1 Tax=Bradyrhizobium liaoningense TaxID=43992 RepID=UPI001BADD8C2|nr:hypothetical protein [Bradyrhizobium liaoningense]MBR0735411.1 hypothetical protein [Bradyrhizobium liaoningense]